jgi:hypothetical protein
MDSLLKDDFSMEPNSSDNINDPELLIGESYNQTLLEMKEDLLKATTRRRQAVLPVALEIFNKI